ncbi:MAG: hypothetical protein BRC26_01010 [Nanohaloarchaea archaeon QH_8_44_6]|nr:MAG: hypothetical protein BRC26_01010 [Nanohaloarchaea archaeon QH_8_44_6]
MVERKIEWKYPLLAALLTAVIFSGIFYTALSLNEYKVNNLKSQIEEVEVEQRSRLVGLQLSENLEKNDCRAVKGWVNTTVDDIRNLRLEVAAYEDSNKIDNREYITVKKRYMNLLLQNLVQIRNYDDACNREVVDIVYFYNDNCNSCTDQATVLTEIRQQYGKDVVVYPLDTELDMQPINFLLNYYDVEEYPTLVINGEVKQGFQSIDSLEQDIESSLNSTNSSES